MTVPQDFSYNTAVYSTAGPYTFFVRMDDPSWFHLYRNGAELTPYSSYGTLVLNVDQSLPGGNFTFTSGFPTPGDVITFRRITPQDQLVLISDQFPFPSGVIMEMFDKLTMLVQDLTDVSKSLIQNLKTYGGTVISNALGLGCPTGWSIVHNSAGNYTITHNLNLALQYQCIQITIHATGITGNGCFIYGTPGVNSFVVQTMVNTTPTDLNFDFALIDLTNQA